MRKILTLFSLFIALSGICAESADALLGRVAAHLKGMKSIVAAYDLTADGKTRKGTLTVSGDRFALVQGGMSAWFDGKTQWTYSQQTAEVNITEPSAEEVQQVNPFAIMGSFRRNYAASYMPSKKPGVKKIKLVARASRADIKAAVVSVNEKTLNPMAITLTLSNGQVVSIAIRNLRDGGSLPASTFKFDKSKYPRAEINDLR